MQRTRMATVQASMAEVMLYVVAVPVIAVLIGTLFAWKRARGVLRGIGEILLLLRSIFVGG